MTSSTPLPPPTEEAMEALRAMIQMMRVVAAPTGVMQRMNETGAWPYLAVLAESLAFEIDLTLAGPAGRFFTDWQPVEEEVRDDD